MMPTRALPDVAVVGGGIVGTAAAALLAAEGARVTLYEREGLAAGASGRNSGVVQRPFDPGLVELFEETVALYRRLEAEEVGFRLPTEPAGLLLLSRQAPLIQRLAASLGAAFPELAPEVVEGGALRALEPGLAADLTACRVPIGYPVPPAGATYAYATLAERLGVRLRLGREAAPAVEGGRTVGVRVDSRLEPAGVVLIAAGPWTAPLVDPTGRWQPIRPLWGVVVETLLASPPRHVLEEAEMDEALGTGDVVAAAGIEHEDPATTPSFSLVPAADVSAVGSTFLDTEPDLAVWQIRILERASRFVPGVAEAPIRGVRACARPASVDGLPLLGPLPGTDGLFVAAGHGPWGISTGPGSARLVVDAILGRPRTIPPDLAAARFGPAPG